MKQKIKKTDRKKERKKTRERKMITLNVSKDFLTFFATSMEGNRGGLGPAVALKP